MSQDAFIKMARSGEHDMELSKKNFELNAQRTELFYRIDNEFSQQLTRQMHVAQNFAICSPSVLLNAVMQRLAGTDIREFDNFMEGVKQHWHKYIERWALRYTDFKQYQETKLPEFTYVKQSAGECISQTMHQWIILFLLSVIFFVTAHMVFVKKDIG